MSENPGHTFADTCHKPGDTIIINFDDGKCKTQAMILSYTQRGIGTPGCLHSFSVMSRSLIEISVDVQKVVIPSGSSDWLCFNGIIYGDDLRMNCIVSLKIK